MDKETQLINRINRNFMDYKARMLKLDGQKIFEKAEEIAAYTQGHWYLTVDHYYEPEELNYFLLFQNPLEVVTDQYQNEVRCVNDVLELVVMNTCDKREALADYPLMKKHGEPER